MNRAKISAAAQILIVAKSSRVSFEKNASWRSLCDMALRSERLQGMFYNDLLGNSGILPETWTGLGGVSEWK